MFVLSSINSFILIMVLQFSSSSDIFFYTLPSLQPLSTVLEILSIIFISFWIPFITVVFIFLYLLKLSYTFDKFTRFKFSDLDF